MATAFHRSLCALGADRFRFTGAGLGAAAVCLGMWGVWAVRAQLTLFEVTREARVEVERAVTPIQAPLAGRVVRSLMEVGREVRAGEVLVELESEGERLAQKEEQARLEGLEPEVEGLRRQMAAEDAAQTSERQAALAALETARAQLREAEAPARYAEEEAERLEKLRRGGLIPQREWEKGQAEARQRRAAVETAQLAIQRIEREQQTRERERKVRMERLSSELANLLTQTAARRAAIAKLGWEIQRRTVAAPAAGRIGEAAVLRAGAFVEEGARLGAIVPEGGLRVVAQFDPPAAFGRLRKGQAARMRLDGFPWAEFGTLPARVSAVANEIRDGKVRVELEAPPGGNPRIPLQHGMPGTVEVEVERISPAAFLLRTAGRWLAEPRREGARE